MWLRSLKKLSSKSSGPLTPQQSNFTEEQSGSEGLDQSCCRHTAGDHRKSERHRAHDGVPGGGKDFGAVVAVVATLQLAGEIVPGQLKPNTAQGRSAGGSVLMV